MLHAHAPRFSPRLRTFLGGAALLLLPACPGEETPIDDTGSSSGSSGTTASPQPDPDSTTSSTPDPDSTTAAGVTGTTNGTDSGTTGDTGTTGGTDSGTTGGTDSSGTTGGTDSGTTEGVSATIGESSSESGIVFILPPDLPAGECDPYLQDCPVGEKCNPFSATGGGSWDANGCFPIDAAPVGVGETCVVDGSGTSGIDNCVAGAMCWDVDAATNEGTCVAQCTGSPAAPVCGAGTSCVITNSGVLNLCLPGCDPLLQDCDPGQACYPVGDGFNCAPDASGVDGADGDECMFINVCDPGLMCINPGAVDGCLSPVGCCTPFCDLSAPGDPCPSINEECVAWYEVGMAPPGLDDVGVCAVPA